MRITFRLLKRIIVIALLPLVLLPPIVVEPLQAVGAAFEGASLEVQQGWVVLTLSGSPYQMGLQQGVLLRPYLRELIGTGLYPSLEGAGVSRWDAQRYGRLMGPRLPESLRDEIRGIAKGAGLPFEEVLLWNLRPDLLALGQDLRFIVREQPWPVIEAAWQLEGSRIQLQPDERLAWPSRPPSVPPNFGGEVPRPLAHSPTRRTRPLAQESRSGASLAVWNDATYDHEPWLAGIVATPAGGERFLLVHREGAGEEPFIGIALPGEVGARAGINASEVAFMMTRFATADRSFTGIPPFMLLRQLLAQSKSSQQAVDFLSELKPTDGTIILVADSTQKEPQQIELSARQVRLHESQEGVLVAAGAPLEGSLATSAALMTGAATTQKDEANNARTEKAARGRIGAWLRLNQGFITAKKLQRLLAEPDVHQQDSAAMLMWQPGSSELWLAQAAQALSAPASGWELLKIEDWLAKENK